MVPRWFGRLVLARFLLPTVAGLYRYFCWAQPLEAKHSLWGKLAGILLTTLLLLGVLRPNIARRLCLPTSLVLTVAGALQFASAIWMSDGRDKGAPS